MSTYTQDFSDATELSYDNTLVTVSGGACSLKDLTPTNSTFYANYTSNINGNWGSGTDLTGTATGGATVGGGYLLLNQNDLRYVDYDADGNADSQVQGCVRFRIKTAYNGTPAADVFLICITKAHNDKDNSIELKHNSANGKIRLIIRDQIGTVFVDSDFGTFNPVNTTDYEIELNYDLSGAGAHRLFIDGTQSAATLTGTGTRDSSIALFRIGSSYGAATNSNFSIKDILVFSTVQHTANYTPTDWSEISATRYTLTNPKVTITPSQFYMEALEGFTETSSVSGSDAITWLLYKGTTDYYYSGGWTGSDGTYSQSTSATNVETNKATYTTSRILFKAEFFLHSNDGSTTPSISNLSITYNYAGETQDTISTCIVWGYLKDITNTVNTTVTISARLNTPETQYKTNVMVFDEIYTDTADSTGYWELELIENANMQTGDKYIFTFPNGTTYERTVPNESTKNFIDLT